MNKTINTQNLNSLSAVQFDWSLVQNEMRNKLGMEIYESWLKKISFEEEFNNYLLLSVPTRFIRDWITSRYLDQILQIIRLFKKDIIRIEFRIADQKKEKNIKDNPINDDVLNENISFMKDSYLQY
tara:strand:- start:5420 stop:5797 length:378 start_codon:yes stop_codon:yes gene_type:complete